VQKPSWVDIVLLAVIVAALAAGCQGALWRADIPQVNKPQTEHSTWTLNLQLRRSSFHESSSCTSY
jgi:hypothetical protein